MWNFLTKLYYWVHDLYAKIVIPASSRTFFEEETVRLDFFPDEI